MLKPNERLKALRKSLGLKVTAFAESIGYTHGTISQIENTPNKQLEKRLVRALHLAFGVNEDWLMKGVGGDQPVFDPHPALDEESLITFIRDCIDQLSDSNREILMNVIRDLAAGEKDADPQSKKTKKSKSSKASKNK